MMLNLASYFTLALFNFVVFPFILGLVIQRLDRSRVIPLALKAILSLGAAPLITNLILYYLLLLLPFNTGMFYLAVIISSYILLAVIFRNQIPILYKELIHRIVKWDKLFISGLFVASVFWQVLVFTVPVLRHDTLEYATLGKVLFKNNRIVYTKNIYDDQSGFYYVGKHGFIFPLFVTTEKYVNSLLHANGDYYFRSITGYYWLLLILAFYYYLQQFVRDRWVSMTALFHLVTTPAMMLAVVFDHIDSARLFLGALSLILLVYSIPKEDSKCYLLLGVILGLLSNLHSLGTLLALLTFPVYFYLSDLAVRDKLKRLLIVLVLLLLFGGIHYAIDIFYGGKWILEYLPLL